MSSCPLKESNSSEVSTKGLIVLCRQWEEGKTRRTHIHPTQPHERFTHTNTATCKEDKEEEEKEGEEVKKREEKKKREEEEEMKKREEEEEMKKREEEEEMKKREEEEEE